MASAPSEPRAVTGRVDRAGRLIAADAAARGPPARGRRRHWRRACAAAGGGGRAAGTASSASPVERAGAGGVQRPGHRPVGARRARRRRIALSLEDWQRARRRRVRGWPRSISPTSRTSTRQLRAMNGRPTANCASSLCRPSLRNARESTPPQAVGHAADPAGPAGRGRQWRHAADQRACRAARLFGPVGAQPERSGSSLVPRRRGRDRRRRRLSPAFAAASSRGRRARRPAARQSGRRCARRGPALAARPDHRRAPDRSSTAATGRCAAIMPVMATISPPPRATCCR